MSLFGFKKMEVSVDDGIMFDTDAGRLNTSDMIEKIKELKKECEDKEKEIATKSDECKKLQEKIAEMEEKEKKDKDEKDDKGDSKENSQDPSTKLNEAAAQAMKDAAGAPHIKTAFKANEKPNVAKVNIRSISGIKK